MSRREAHILALQMVKLSLILTKADALNAAGKMTNSDFDAIVRGGKAVSEAANAEYWQLSRRRSFR